MADVTLASWGVSCKQTFAVSKVTRRSNVSSPVHNIPHSRLPVAQTSLQNRKRVDWIGSGNSGPSDEVHILPGSPAPFILRRLDESLRADSQTEAMPAYNIIGNTYLHEIMFGGAFKNDDERNIKQLRFPKSVQGQE